VARWRNGEWSAVDNSDSAQVHDFLVAPGPGGNDVLYVGGDFAGIGGVQSRYLVVRDGTRWTAPPIPYPGSHILCLERHDDGGGPALYAGTFVPGGAAGSPSTWRFRDGVWTDAGISTDDQVRDLVSFDDGNQRGLFIGGQFSGAGTTASSNFAFLTDLARPRFVRYPDSRRAIEGATLHLDAVATATEAFEYQWHKDGVLVVDDGRISGARTRTLTIMNAGAADAGVYSVVASNECGAATSPGGTVLPPCPADWNRTGTVTSSDFYAFLRDFFADAGDYNHDGITNSADLFDFLAAFFTPCEGMP
jgi:hypothetical protein